MNIKILDIGLSKYSNCYSLQKKILNDVKSNDSQGYIILTEHYPVFTIGRSGSRKNILVSAEFLKVKGIEVVEVDRGGDITYHGPGQLVIYPIIKMGSTPYFPKDLHKYLRYLEEVIIRLLQEYNINAFRINGRTGVWTDKGKIASIGIGVSKWITYHGVALNVNCDLTPFSWINPCGFKDIKIALMSDLIGVIDKEQVKRKLIELFCNTKNLEHCSLD